MKKLAFLFISFMMACTPNTDTEQRPVNQNSSKTDLLQIDLTENAALDYKNMRIYPVDATAEFIAANQSIAHFKNLKEAIEIKGFRITEKKPFGRFDDQAAVNNLTVQNKSKDTIILLEGDIVQGGRQDRILAQSMIIPPRTITDIPVFCVEPNRWEYKEVSHEDLAEADVHQNEQNRKVAAFTGYYNIASSDLRRTMRETNNQQRVWDKVGQLTSLNNAESHTGAYSNLENSDEFTQQRDLYRDFFMDKFDETSKTVGMVVVSGNKILGAEVFGHPDLFRKQYEILLHSYITDAISNGKEVTISAKKMQSFQQGLNQDFKQDKTKQLKHKGKLVHFTSF